MTTIRATAVHINQLTDLELASGLASIVRLRDRFGPKQAYVDCTFSYITEIDRRRAA